MPAQRWADRHAGEPESLGDEAIKRRLHPRRRTVAVGVLRLEVGRPAAADREPAVERGPGVHEAVVGVGRHGDDRIRDRLGREHLAADGVDDAPQLRHEPRQEPVARDDDRPRGGGRPRGRDAPAVPAPLDREHWPSAPAPAPPPGSQRPPGPSPSAPAAARSRPGRRWPADSAPRIGAGISSGASRQSTPAAASAATARLIGSASAVVASHRLPVRRTASAVAAGGRERQHVGERRPGRPVQREGGRHPDQRRGVVQPKAGPGRCKAAVSATRAGRDLTCLQHEHRCAALGQPKRAGTAGHARAHDHDIGGRVALERREPRPRAAAPARGRVARTSHYATQRPRMRAGTGTARVRQSR